MKSPTMTDDRVEELVRRLHDEEHCYPCDLRRLLGGADLCRNKKEVRAAVRAGLELAAEVAESSCPAPWPNSYDAGAKKAAAAIRALAGKETP
jgi:hypothetical protein